MNWAEVLEKLVFGCERRAVKALVFLYQIKAPKSTSGHSLILIPVGQGEEGNFALNKLDH